MSQGKLSRADEQKAVSLVRRGMSYRKVGEEFGVSHETIRKIVQRRDPKLADKRGWKEPRPTPAPRFCANHPDRELGPTRRRYCTNECAEAEIILQNITTYREMKLRAVSRAEGREGRIRPGTLNRQLLHKNTKTYKVLKRQGLLDRLPEFVEIR